MGAGKKYGQKKIRGRSPRIFRYQKFSRIFLKTISKISDLNVSENLFRI